MIKVGIVGGTGYTGVELLRLLAQHPEAELRAITSRKEAGSAVSAMFPALRRQVDLKFTEPTPQALRGCDVVFFATPNGVAMGEARAILDAGARVIDLSADFRIRDVTEWERWYKTKHAAHPERVLEKAVKGMLPKGPLGYAMLRKLKVYGGGTHPHSAQQPKNLEI